MIGVADSEGALSGEKQHTSWREANRADNILADAQQQQRDRFGCCNSSVAGLNYGPGDDGGGEEIWATAEVQVGRNKRSREEEEAAALLLRSLNKRALIGRAVGACLASGPAIPRLQRPQSFFAISDFAHTRPLHHHQTLHIVLPSTRP